MSLSADTQPVPMMTMPSAGQQYASTSFMSSMLHVDRDRFLLHSAINSLQKYTAMLLFSYDSPDTV